MLRLKKAEAILTVLGKCFKPLKKIFLFPAGAGAIPAREAAVREPR
jgi:hypothetical protein